MINKFTKILLFVFFSVFLIPQSNATHMVGGDFTYRCGIRDALCHPAQYKYRIERVLRELFESKAF